MSEDPGKPLKGETGHPDDSHAQNELGPDEPETPLWLTLLGGALALVAIIYFVASRPDAKTTDQLRHGSEPAEASASASAAPAPPVPAPMPPARPNP